MIFGGFIYSGGFLGIDGFGYGWDKTRVGPRGAAGGLRALPLGIFIRTRSRSSCAEEVAAGAAQEEEARNPELSVQQDAVGPPENCDPHFRSRGFATGGALRGPVVFNRAVFRLAGGVPLGRVRPVPALAVAAKGGRGTGVGGVSRGAAR